MKFASLLFFAKSGFDLTSLKCSPEQPEVWLKLTAVTSLVAGEADRTSELDLTSPDSCGCLNA